MGLQLVHRTNYRGKVLTGRCGDSDTGGLELLWTQAVYPRDDGTARPCCFGFGKRSVWVTPDMLRTQHESIWELWHVGSEDGYTAGHRFHKFVLMPRGADEEETEVEYSDSDSDRLGVLPAPRLSGLLERAVGARGVGALPERPRRARRRAAGVLRRRRAGRL